MRRGGTRISGYKYYARLCKLTLVDHLNCEIDAASERVI